MSRRFVRQYPTGIGVLVDPTMGIVFDWKAGAPTASVVGYAKGALVVDVTNGTVYENTGTLAAATWTALPTGAASNAVSGVAAGYKIARGVTALDGSNPTPITTSGLKAK